MRLLRGFEKETAVENNFILPIDKPFRLWLHGGHHEQRLLENPNGKIPTQSLEGACACSRLRESLSHDSPTSRREVETLSTLNARGQVMSTPEQAHEVWMEIYSQARCYDGSVEAAGRDTDPTLEQTPDSHTPAESALPPERTP